MKITSSFWLLVLVAKPNDQPECFRQQDPAQLREGIGQRFTPNVINADKRSQPGVLLKMSDDG